MRLNALLGALALYAFPVLSLAHTADHPEDGISLLLIAVILGGLLVGLVGAGIAYGIGKRGRVVLIVGAGIWIMAGGVLAALVPLAYEAPIAEAQPELAGVRMEVFKSPGCSCCGGFISELKAQSADVVVHEVSDEELSRIKKQHGVSEELESCHTTLVGGYVVEGHMPFEVIAKLLTEQPEIEGIALPGMPAGTPGMPGMKTGPYRIHTLSGEEYATL